MTRDQHLNYSRQLVKYCMNILSIPSIDPEYRAMASSVLDLHGASTKFMLPSGGRLYDDLGLRALDEDVPLRLPYQYLCLEYHQDIANPLHDGAGFVDAPKRVVYARERSGFIVVTVAFWAKHDGSWRILPECAIPVTGYLDRTVSVAGRPVIKAAYKDSRIPINDYADELGALLCFLNVLQCSNVHVERSDPKRGGKKLKTAIPFDAYHILTIDVPGKAVDGAATGGGHRSPREHLRRGHIRRLADGRRIWVNATVVAAGRGAGVVTKDYAVRCASGVDA